jgi:hypothetical protein
VATRRRRSRAGREAQERRRRAAHAATVSRRRRRLRGPGRDPPPGRGPGWPPGGTTGPCCGCGCTCATVPAPASGLRVVPAVTVTSPPTSRHGRSPVSPCRSVWDRFRPPTSSVDDLLTLSQVTLTRP